MNEPQAKPIKILFVCLANLCRSPMAEVIAMDSPVFMRLSEMKEIPKDKPYGWEVADPCGLGIEAYERTALQIEDDLENFILKIEEDHV